MSDIAPYFFVLLTFGAVAAAVFGLGRYVSIQMQIQRRLPASGMGGSDSPGFQSTARLYAFIAKHFDERRFGVDNTLRGKLRRDLVRAGFSAATRSISISSFDWRGHCAAVARLRPDPDVFAQLPLLGKFGVLLILASNRDPGNGCLPVSPSAPDDRQISANISGYARI